MSPERTGPDGWYRLDRVLPGVGRIRVRSGKTLAMHNRVDALVSRLFEQGRLQELRLLKAKAITSMALIDADRRNRQATDPMAAKLAEPLFPLARRLFAGNDPTTRRYRISFVQLDQAEVLPVDATLRDVGRLDWAAIEAAWPTSAADWNHLRRAISRMLTLQVGEHHPERHRILSLIPVRPETERLVELTPAEFQALIRPAHPVLQDVFWALAATGMRSWAEYAHLTRDDLGPKQIRITRSKNAKSHRVIPVDAAFWPHVLRAVPCPFKRDYVYRAFKACAIAAGRPELWLRDLRHCYCFWSLEAMVPINVVQRAAGHASLATTQKYVVALAKREHAAALAAYLIPQSAPQRKTKKA